MKPFVWALSFALLCNTSMVKAQFQVGGNSAAAINYSVDIAKKQFVALAERLSVNISNDIIDDLADIEVSICGNKAKTPQERRQGYKKIISTLAVMAGVDTTNFDRIMNQNLTLASISSFSISKPHVYPSIVTPDNELGNIVRIGNGKVPLIVIADFDADEHLYTEMANLMKDRFSVYIITLPGTSGTPPLRWPGINTVVNTTWWQGVEAGIVKYIKENGISKPIIAGTMSSGYLTTKLAVNYPHLFSKAIIFNTLVYAPMPSLSNADIEADFSERQSRVRKSLLTFWMELVPNYPPTAPETTMSNLSKNPQIISSALFYTRDTTKARSLISVQANKYSKVKLRYLNELQATDLSINLQHLTIPLLVVPTVYDDKSGTSAITAGYTQWEEMQLKYPKIPLQIYPIYDTRSYATLDKPELCASIILNFMNGISQEKYSSKEIKNRKSPLLSASLNKKNFRCEVQYGSPSVNGRDVWGKLVPYGYVWRAGANEATTIFFSKGVRVGNITLSRGTYSLFIIPNNDDEKWIIVFNKVVHQWGAFNYKSIYDAARITVKAETVSSFSEMLLYTVQQKADKNFDVSLTWANKRISFPFSL
jgi:pimeloyl-ACP methyl ester carboxylesterase